MLLLPMPVHWCVPCRCGCALAAMPMPVLTCIPPPCCPPALPARSAQPGGAGSICAPVHNHVQHAPPACGLPLWLPRGLCGGRCGAPHLQVHRCCCCRCTAAAAAAACPRSSAGVLPALLGGSTHLPAVRYSLCCAPTQSSYAPPAHHCARLLHSFPAACRRWPSRRATCLRTRAAAWWCRCVASTASFCVAPSSCVRCCHLLADPSTVCQAKPLTCHGSFGMPLASRLPCRADAWVVWAGQRAGDHLWGGVQAAQQPAGAGAGGAPRSRPTAAGPVKAGSLLPCRRWT